MLLRTERWTLVTFGLFASIGVLLATWLGAARLLQVAGEQAGPAIRALFLTALLGVAGTRLLALALDWRTLLEAPSHALRKTGFAFQGAVLLVLPAMYLYMRATGLSPWLMLDTLSLVLPLGHAIGRVGCFTYGCCHGRPTASRWGVRYSNPLSKAIWDSRLEGVALHPAQLYEAALVMGLFLALNLAASGPLPSGTVTGLYLAGYGLLRVGLEHFRGEPGLRCFGMTAYQAISLGICAAGVGLVLLRVGQPGIDWGQSGLAGHLLVASTDCWPVILANAVLFLGAYGVHGRTVGRW